MLPFPVAILSFRVSCRSVRKLSSENDTRTHESMDAIAKVTVSYWNEAKLQKHENKSRNCIDLCVYNSLHYLREASTVLKSKRFMRLRNIFIKI